MRKVKFFLCFLMSLAILFLSGCMVLDTEEEGDYKLYYTNFEVTGLESEVYDAKGTTVEELIQELLGALSLEPKDNKHFVLLNEDVTLERYEYDGNMVNLYMSRSYNEMPKTKEILVRAGLVRTLVQIDGVDSVQIFVGGFPLLDSKGNEIGPMESRTFIENSGKEINNYKRRTVSLYFTNAEGNRLVEEVRELRYSSNVPVEQIIVEHLIQGPKEAGHYATLPKAASVLSAAVVDRVCYVNFNKAFLEQALSIQQDIPIYSISQSLMQNCDIDYVQIAVNGNSDLIFRESMPLNQYYQKNNALVITEPEVTPTIQETTAPEQETVTEEIPSDPTGTENMEGGV